MRYGIVPLLPVTGGSMALAMFFGVPVWLMCLILGALLLYTGIKLWQTILGAKHARKQ